MTLAHSEFQKLLPDYINGHLDALLRSEIEMALVQNPEWRKEVCQIEDMQRYLRETRLDQTRAESLERLRQNNRMHFQRAFRPRKPRPSFRRKLLVYALGLGLIFVFAGYRTLQSPPEALTDAAVKIALASSPTGPNIQVVLETDNPKIAIYWSFENEVQP